MKLYGTETVYRYSWPNCWTDSESVHMEIICAAEVFVSAREFTGEHFCVREFEY